MSNLNVTSNRLFNVIYINDSDKFMLVSVSFSSCEIATISIRNQTRTHMGDNGKIQFIVAPQCEYKLNCGQGNIESWCEELDLTGSLKEYYNAGLSILR